MNWITDGSVTTPLGFSAAGVYCGIKTKKKKDLALIVSEVEASVGATFTTNRIKAAPLKLSMQNARRGRARAIVANSGNANACTGVEGLRAAKDMVARTAALIGCKRSNVLVCSTGKIGEPLPLKAVLSGIDDAFSRLSRFGGAHAAKAIRTTDTTTKQCAVQVTLGGKAVHVGGMAKGAGMIHPNMATMLGFLTCDAAVPQPLLQQLTSEAVNDSFNRISVDGDTSTNDTVFVLCNGMAGGEVIDESHPELPILRDAIKAVMNKLARMIIEDGENITHVIQVKVCGAATDTDARRIGDAIAHSPLVKSSWAGNDPNWGRLMDVIGYSGARVREELIDIHFDGLCAVQGGTRGNAPESRLRRVAAKRTYTISIQLHMGEGSAEMWINDLTPGYVKFNMGE